MSKEINRRKRPLPDTSSEIRYAAGSVYQTLPKRALLTNSFPVTFANPQANFSTTSQCQARNASGPVSTYSSSTTIAERFKSIDAAILRNYERSKQTPQAYEDKMKLVDYLFNSLARVHNGCGLFLVGSSITGLGDASSDIDLCLMLDSAKVSSRDQQNILQEIQKMLYNIPQLRRVLYIKAVVPIVKFYDTVSKRECDMSINNDVSIRNSHLLYCYCQYDHRVAPLIMFIKKWAKFHRINSARDNTLSSYVLSLMVIHYLQCGVSGDGPVLASLQKSHPDLFTPEVAKLRLNARFERTSASQQNAMSAGQLLLGFFRYYSNTFRFEKDVISVRESSIMNIHDVRMMEEQLPNQNVGGTNFSKNAWANARLFIEEPFTRANAARSVYEPNSFATIRRVMRASYTKLEQTMDANSIITHPF